MSSFVLKVPQRNLRPSVIYSVPCDRILQRAYLAQEFGISKQQISDVRKNKDKMLGMKEARNLFARLMIN